MPQPHGREEGRWDRPWDLAGPCGEGYGSSAGGQLGSGAPAQPVRLNFTKMNTHTHTQLCRCTTMLVQGGEKVRGTKEDTTLSGQLAGAHH